MVWRGEIPPGLVRLSEVQAVTVPAWLLPSCQAQELPNSMATPRVGGHQVSPSSCFLLLRSRAPGAQGCPAPAACQLPGAPAPEEPPGACLGSSPAPRAGRCAGSRAPALLLLCPAGFPARWTDRRQAPSMATSLGNLGTWDLGENILFFKKSVHGQISMCRVGRWILRLLLELLALWCAGSAFLSEFSDSTLGLAHKSKAVPRVHYHSLAHRSFFLTYSAEKPYRISSTSHCGKNYSYLKLCITFGEFLSVITKTQALFWLKILFP